MKIKVQNILIISALCIVFLISITIRPPTQPDLNLEQELRLQIANLKAHLELAEQVNIDMKENLRKLQRGGQNLSHDLSLPSIRYSLPHVTKSYQSLNLPYKWSKGTVFENHEKSLILQHFLTFFQGIAIWK